MGSKETQDLVPSVVVGLDAVKSLLSVILKDGPHCLRTESNHSAHPGKRELELVFGTTVPGAPVPWRHLRGPPGEKKAESKQPHFCLFITMTFLM